jgi:hypothetical protein
MKEIQCGNISISYFHRNATMKNNSSVKPLNSMQRHVSGAFSLHSLYPHHFNPYFYRNYLCSIALLCTPGSQRYNHNNTYLTLYNPKPQECRTFLYYHNFTVIRNDWHINTKLFLRSSKLSHILYNPKPKQCCKNCLRTTVLKSSRPLDV